MWCFVDLNNNYLEHKPYRKTSNTLVLHPNRRIYFLDAIGSGYTNPTEKKYALVQKFVFTQKCPKFDEYFNKI